MPMNLSVFTDFFTECNSNKRETFKYEISKFYVFYKRIIYRSCDSRGGGNSCELFKPFLEDFFRSGGSLELPCPSRLLLNLDRRIRFESNMIVKYMLLREGFK